MIFFFILIWFQKCRKLKKKIEMSIEHEHKNWILYERAQWKVSNKNTFYILEKVYQHPCPL